MVADEYVTMVSGRDTELLLGCLFKHSSNHISQDDKLQFGGFCRSHINFGRFIQISANAVYDPVLVGTSLSRSSRRFLSPGWKGARGAAKCGVIDIWGQQLALLTLNNKNTERDAHTHTHTLKHTRTHTLEGHDLYRPV